MRHVEITSGGLHLIKIAAPPRGSPLLIIANDDQRQIDRARNDPAAHAVEKPNGHPIAERFRAEPKIIMLLEEWFLTAPDGEAVTFAGRALPEVTEPATISVRAWLKQENLDFLDGRSMPAFGNDLSDHTATDAPQYIQVVQPRHPYGKIEILAFVGDRQPQLLVGSKARHFSP